MAEPRGLNSSTPINHRNALSEAPAEEQSRDLIVAGHGTFVVVFVQPGRSQHVVFILNCAGGRK